MPHETRSCPPLAEKKNRHLWRNGVQVSNTTTTVKGLFTLNRGGKGKFMPFSFDTGNPLASLASQDSESLNSEARALGLISATQTLREFQVDATNYVLGRTGDLCIIATTGSGKSLVWTHPLNAQTWGISLVVVPYTSLRHQGALRRLVMVYIGQSAPFKSHPSGRTELSC
jgi:hypothetical protein